MKKLALRMEELAVESFTTLNAEDKRGTVRGQEMGPTVPSCPSINLCVTEDCLSGGCPTSRTTLCRC
ncbi:MAG TPA: hypothetical protein VFS20_15960 [Longimicrobium sp.]|nr:hypothetical protein [Longimicrobium sp.]